MRTCCWLQLLVIGVSTLTESTETPNVESLKDSMPEIRTFPKLQAVQAAKMMEDSRKMSLGNWQAGQNQVWGENAQQVKGSADDMIAVESPITNTTHNHFYGEADKPKQQAASPVAAPSTDAKPSALGGLAKAAIGAALLSTGVGGGVGLSMLMDGGKDVVKTVIEKPAEDTPQRAYNLTLGE